MGAFFINIEGIDGAGKSTLAKNLFSLARKEGLTARLIEKRELTDFIPYKQQHLKTIMSVLWDYSDDDPIESLGNQHWYHLIAAWYYAIAHEIASETVDVCFLDGYYYKYLSRFSLKSNSDMDYLRGVYKNINQPNQNILLEISSQEALSRKDKLMKSEAGQLDGYKHNMQSSFVEYQKQVSNSLEQEIGFAGEYMGISATLEPDKLTEQVWSSVVDKIISRKNSS